MAQSVVDLNTLDPKKGFFIETRNGSATRVTSLGDINGDGFADALVSDDTLPNANSRFGGATYVVFGGEDVGSSGKVKASDLNGSNGFKIESTKPGITSFGHYPRGVGDINGDGFDDFSAKFSIRGQRSAGSFLLLGGKDIGASGSMDLGDISNSTTLLHTRILGDINGDGINELRYNKRLGGDELYLGSEKLGKPGVDLSKSALLDPSKRVNFVNSINGRPEIVLTEDINGDGFEDLLVNDSSSPPMYSHKKGKGAAHVIFGGSDVGSSDIDLSKLDGSNGFTLNYFDDGYIRLIYKVGDLNGDGFNEVAFEVDGKAKVLFGKESGFNADIDIRNLNSSDGFSIEIGKASTEIKSAGDFNGDGIDDLAISSSVKDSTFIVNGSKNISENPEVIDLEKDSRVGTIFRGAGSGVDLAGDVNGDGADDLIVSQALSTSSNGKIDGAYILYGTPKGGTTPPPGDNMTGTNPSEPAPVGTGDILTGGGQTSTPGSEAPGGTGDILAGGGQTSTPGSEAPGGTGDILTGGGQTSTPGSEAPSGTGDILTGGGQTSTPGSDPIITGGENPSTNPISGGTDNSALTKEFLNLLQSEDYNGVFKFLMSSDYANFDLFVELMRQNAGSTTDEPVDVFGKNSDPMNAASGLNNIASNPIVDDMEHSFTF